MIEGEGRRGEGGGGGSVWMHSDSYEKTIVFAEIVKFSPKNYFHPFAPPPRPLDEMLATSLEEATFILLTSYVEDV